MTVEIGHFTRVFCNNQLVSEWATCVASRWLISKFDRASTLVVCALPLTCNIFIYLCILKLGAFISVLWTSTRNYWPEGGWEGGRFELRPVILLVACYQSKRVVVGHITKMMANATFTLCIESTVQYVMFNTRYIKNILYINQSLVVRCVYVVTPRNNLWRRFDHYHILRTFNKKYFRFGSSRILRCIACKLTLL